MRLVLVGIFTLALGATSARAQGSLGGYGGSMSSFDSGMGSSGPIIPYAGHYGGFMPSRMSGSSSLAFTSRGMSSVGSPRTSFRLSTMSGRMPSTGSGMSGGPGGGGGMGQMPKSSGMGVMPPSFAYPFRQPPSLFAPLVSGSGMSM